MRVVSIVVLLLLAGSAPPRAATRPNLLLVYADDLGWKDVGYQGTDFYETPNIDRLAREGMIFTQSYAGAGNCAPSRACLLSGQYTPRHGVYAVDSTDRGPKQLMRMIPIPNRSGLPASTVTVADALKAAGYATGIFGKWHLGGPEGAAPQAQGFDVVFDSRAPNPNAKRDQPDDPKGIYSLTREAIAFIERNRNRPFFAFVSHHAIHTALEARPSSLAKFQAKKPGRQHHNPVYAACLYDLDDGVGRLLEKLKQLGLEQNTLVVFTSDNGGTQQSSQEPLRGSKGGYYEGGIREPFIVRWPGIVKPGSRSTAPVHQADFYPTFLAAAGADTPSGHTLDGESLLPLLTGKGALQRQAIFWHFPGYLDTPVIRGRDPVFRTRPVSVIRKGDWKLHLYHEEWQLDGGRAKIATNRAVELYHIASDIGERRDLAGTARPKRDELLDDLLAWLKAINAPLPVDRNPAYDPGKTLPEKRSRP
ncbi:MAG TPA: sulfatase [Vicinamibacterales bacterium]|jgi:arylsulfatase A-like enzyme